MYFKYNVSTFHVVVAHYTDAQQQLYQRIPLNAGLNPRIEYFGKISRINWAVVPDSQDANPIVKVKCIGPGVHSV